MIDTRDKQKKHNTALDLDFTSSDAISSKSTVLSLPIWNILSPLENYRHDKQQHKHCVCLRVTFPHVASCHKDAGAQLKGSWRGNAIL